MSHKKPAQDILFGLEFEGDESDFSDGGLDAEDTIQNEGMYGILNAEFSLHSQFSNEITSIFNF